MLSVTYHFVCGFAPPETSRRSPTPYQIGRIPCFQPVSLDAAGKRKRRRRKDQLTEATEVQEEPTIQSKEPPLPPNLKSNVVEDVMSVEEDLKADDFAQIRDVANFEFESDGPAAIGKLTGHWVLGGFTSWWMDLRPQYNQLRRSAARKRRCNTASGYQRDSEEERRGGASTC